MAHTAKAIDREIGARDTRSADEVISSIDSAGWDVDPRLVVSCAQEGLIRPVGERQFLS